MARRPILREVSKQQVNIPAGGFRAQKGLAYGGALEKKQVRGDIEDGGSREGKKTQQLKSVRGGFRYGARY